MLNGVIKNYKIGHTIPETIRTLKRQIRFWLAVLLEPLQA